MTELGSCGEQLLLSAVGSWRGWVGIEGRQIEELQIY